MGGRGVEWIKLQYGLIVRVSGGLGNGENPAIWGKMKKKSTFFHFLVTIFGLSTVIYVVEQLWWQFVKEILV